MDLILLATTRPLRICLHSRPLRPSPTPLSGSFCAPDFTARPDRHEARMRASAHNAVRAVVHARDGAAAACAAAGRGPPPTRLRIRGTRRGRPLRAPTPPARPPPNAVNKAQRPACDHICTGRSDPLIPFSLKHGVWAESPVPVLCQNPSRCSTDTKTRYNARNVIMYARDGTILSRTGQLEANRRPAP